MIYREYGKTGKKISVIAAGGMRYAKPEAIEEMAQIPLEAARLGVNYFDTAPGYCNNKSEAILGCALKLIKKEKLPYYTSTKTWAPDYDLVFKHIESSLKILGVNHIDFMHSWGVNSRTTFEERKSKGAFKALQKAKEQGLISHVVCSSHMSGADIAWMLDQGIFEGITLGFCAINFPFRMKGLESALHNKLGVVTMNPLGGGTITDNPDRFSFIKTRPDQSILEAALHFNLAHKEITAALVGFRSTDDVRTAVKTVESYKPISDPEMASIKSKIEKSFDRICTTCNYCKDCPESIPVVKFMESYNHYLLYNEAGRVFDRLRWHWDLQDISALENCTQCRHCEEVCTQKLPILKRFEEIRGLKAKMKAAKAG